MWNVFGMRPFKYRCQEVLSCQANHYNRHPQIAPAKKFDLFVNKIAQGSRSSGRVETERQSMNPHSNLPHFLRDSCLQTLRMPGEPSHQPPKYLAFTRQRHLFLVRQQNVLATCDLSTVFLPHDADAAAEAAPKITLDAFFTYRPQAHRRDRHILLHVGQTFAIIGKSGGGSSVVADDDDHDGGVVDSMELVYAATDIAEFSVVPGDDDIADDDAGQVNVRFVNTAGLAIEKPLHSLRNIIDAGRNSAPPATTTATSYTSEPIVRAMRTGLLDARTGCAAQRERNERLARVLRERRRFGAASQRGACADEKQMLARYGDIWWRRLNDDELVVGVPVFNCTFKR